MIPGLEAMHPMGALLSQEGVTMMGEAVMEQSMKCIAYNERYLMMGFASDKTVADEKLIVPRTVALDNFRLCGVMLAYVSEGRASGIKRAMGWNFAPDHLGARVMAEINDLVLRKRLKPVVGRVVNFEEIPSAIQALASRETVGRTIVRLW